MVTPRQTYSVTNVTRPSELLADPALVFDLHGRDPASMIAALDEAGDRVRAMIDSWRQPWAQAAACIGVDIDVFFSAKHKLDALALCGRCPSRTPCLEEALADPSLDHGVRGGADVAARKLMRKQRGAT